MTHKKRKKKYLHILLIPDDESATRKLKIRYSILMAAMITAVFLLLAFLIGFFTYGQLLQKAYENRVLNQENEQLKQQLQKVNELTSELENLKTFGRKIHNNLSGYVSIRENIENVSSLPQAENASDISLISVFKSVPLKPPVTGFLSQEFKNDLHNGIDIVAPEGTPIVAAADGIVLYSGWTYDGGNTIIIGHQSGFYTYYKHNLRNLVLNNSRVTQGEVIAYLGNSGEKSYGPHLHFEIWHEGQPIDPINLILEYNQ